MQDPDIGDEHEFGLVAGTGGEDNAMFTLVGNELRSNATYDFEANNTFSVLISATDISGLSVAKAFTITINDDRSEDFDNDGLTEAQEEDTYGTSDLDPDSDNDGSGRRTGGQHPQHQPRGGGYRWGWHDRWMGT